MDKFDTNLLRDLAAQTQASTERYVSGDLSNRAARVAALQNARKLVTELQDGDDAWFTRCSQMSSGGALYFMLCVGAIDKIPKEGSISAEKLANETTLEKDVIVRNMRLICASGVIAEPEPGMYAHTKRSLVLQDPGYAGMEKFLVRDVLAKCIVGMPEYFSTHESASYKAPFHNIMSWAMDMEGKDWSEAMMRTPELRRDFQLGMAGEWKKTMYGTPFPFDSPNISAQLEKSASTSPPRKFLVDVGGGWGGAVKEIFPQSPKMKGEYFVVQDSESVIGQIPAGFLPEGVTTQVHDFFTPNPIKGACIYFLRQIIHDWSDEPAIKILSSISEAMAEDSVVLISDMIVPERVEKEDNVYWLDFCMLILGGQERTVADLSKLFERSGLELSNVYHPPYPGLNSYVEARKK